MPNQDDNRFDRVSSVAKAALAIGAGAAFLYRGGGDELLSKGFKRTTMALNGAMQDLSAKTLSDMNGNAKSVITNVIENYKSRYADLENVKATLRLDSKDSLLNTLQYEARLNNDPSSMLRSMFVQEVFIPGIKRDLQNGLSDLSPKRVNNIADNITTHISSALEYIEKEDEAILPDVYQLSQQFKKENADILTDEHIQTIEDVIKERFANKRVDTEEYITQHNDLIENFKLKLLDYDSLESNFGSVQKPKKKSFFETLLGDTQVTVRQLIDNEDQIEKTNFILGGDNNSVDVIQRLRALVDQDERYGDLYIDKTLRMNKDGVIRSFAELKNKEEELESQLLHTLPGKLLKPLEARVYGQSAPNNFFFVSKGSGDYILPKLIEGNQSTILENSYMKINNKGYKIVNNELVRESRMDDLLLTSGKYGSYVRIAKHITGDVDYSTRSRNILFEALDVNSSPKLSKLENLKLKAKKFKDPEWGPNFIKSIFSFESKYEDERDYFANMQQLNKLFKRSTSKMDKTTAARLSNLNQDKATREIFDLLALDDESLLKAISNQNTGNKKRYFHNEDALSLINRYKKDPLAARNIVSISQDTVSMGINFKYTKAEKYTDLLRKELSKEALLRYKDAYGGDALYNMLNRAKLNASQRKNAKALANWAIFQNTGEIFSKEISPKTSEQLIDSKKQLVELFLSNSDDASNKERLMKKEFKSSVIQMVKDKSSLLFDESAAPSSHIHQIEKANRPNNFIFMQKGISPLDVIKNLNDTEKLKSFGKQFVAGRNDMENFTGLSFYPYFALHRLTDSLPFLAFSPKNIGSVGDLAKNIMTKRVMPIAGAGFALSYLNYEARNITGKSLTEAAYNSKANFTLGIKSIIDKTPFDESFKDFYYTNDISNYRNDSPYRTAEEERQWLATGVQPVRKGRWWGMSTSEFRGGKIEYFEPNKLRQKSVAWRDIGVYGSSEEKWKHSIIPTLRHPLSPIRYLLDPYWLEEKNKYSRPYPVSAPMFGQGTPWSGMLNMTIGDAIKPQKRMHKEVLGNDFVDVRDLIMNQNNKIKSRAAQDDKYIMLTDSNSATEERHFDFSNAQSLKGSGIIGGDQVDLKNFTKQSGVNAPYSVTGNSFKSDTAISIADKIVLASMDAGFIMPQLEDINARIKAKATTRGMSETGYAKRFDALVAADSIDIVRDKDTLAELRNLSSTKENIRDMGYAAKQLTGIYGFLFEEILPSKKRHVLANASAMSSFSRSFWDESFGGAGGGFMEIARRFFPHANRNNIEVNTIRNNMPSWMPESFKHGDPYTKVKKGEMRLPGRAYEAMNKYAPNLDFSIHPYMIGSSKDELIQYYLNKNDMNKYLDSMPKNAISVSEKDMKQTQQNIQAAQKTINSLINSGKLNSGEFYNDFQRFKILADVSPFTDEFKEYKSKVKSQLTEANRKEYYDILDRVDKQSKQHDFYKYRYLKTNFNHSEAYIDTVTKDGFTVIGSNKVYSMAGIKTQDAISSKISSGMKVQLTYDKLDENDDFIKTIVHFGSENLNRSLIKDKVAERSSNGDAIDAHAIATGRQKILGAAAEVIGHAPIPWIHNRFLKIETPLESYRNEQVYGTPYATWSHPIQGYLQPAFNKAFAAGPVHASLGIAAFAANLYFNDLSKKTFAHGDLIRKAAEVSNLIMTPGAATGAIASIGLKLGFNHVDKGVKIGSAIWGAGYLAVNAKNPLMAAGAGLSLGKLAGEFWDKGTGNKGSLIGLGIGLGISYLKNPDFNIKEMSEKWIPKKTKKRWEIEEYFDRLNYIKYQGLFEKASRKALKKENVNIKQLLKEMEEAENKSEKQKEKLLNYKKKLSNSYISNTDYGKGLMMRIDSQLTNPLDSKIVKAGEYTKSAIAYKQAMDSTIYGLKKNASWAQILRALPKNDRDYFLEFAKEKDKNEQDKILKMISPYKRKILQNIWGRETDTLKSNSSYFSSNNLPGMFWSGWKPNVDMDHIQMKTIENEGMLLSDFGFYDSNKNTPGYEETEPVKYDRDTNLLSLKANLFSSLNGLGLIGVNVSIEPSQMPGIQMIADFAKITDFKVKQRINQTFGRTYY